MPVAVTFPGVYIQEIPSGVHTIAGVSTSVTAFVGRAFRGPVNLPTTINGYADYQRFFGGLNADSTISYSVRDFFQNGGGQGVVVRLFSPPDPTGAYTDQTATISVAAPQSVFLAVNAALTVANAAWMAAAQPGATVTSVQKAASFSASGYRTRTTAEQLAVSNPAKTGVYDVIAAVSVPANGGTPTEAQKAANQGMSAVTTAVTAGVPSLLHAATLLLTGTADGLNLGWGEVVGASPTPAGAAAAMTGMPGPVTDAATIAAGQAGATPQSVVLAASGAAAAAVAAAYPNALTFAAASPGDWANGSLSVAVDQAGIPAAQLESRLNVYVSYSDPTGGAMTESFLAVSVDPAAGANRLDAVLAAQSNFIAYTYVGPTAPPLPAGPAWGMASGGTASLPLQEADYLGNENEKTGMYALDHYDLFNILVIPPDTRAKADTPNDWLEGVYQTAAAYCLKRRAFLIIDPPFAWTADWKAGNTSTAIAITDLGSYGPEGENAAVYFPHLIEGDPLMGGQPMTMPPSGAIAGIYARTDAARGVWKAPAGITDGAISGVMGLEIKMTDADNGFLNPQGINALRSFPTFGSVVWGARTLWGSDARSDDYKYVPVRRLVLYLEESLYRGTQWAVFEPNAEPLWASLRLAVGGFLNDLFRQGAFAGTSVKDAYFVACDATTTPQNDIDLGIVNVKVGFAPLKPAEFVVLTIQQIAGQTAT